MWLGYFAGTRCFSSSVQFKTTRISANADPAWSSLANTGMMNRLPS